MDAIHRDLVRKVNAAAGVTDPLLRRAIKRQLKAVHENQLRELGRPQYTSPYTPVMVTRADGSRMLTFQPASAAKKKGRKHAKKGRKQIKC